MEEERNFTGAIHHYEQAADLFHEENHHSMANKCAQKVAEFAAIDGQYQKAIKIFQVNYFVQSNHSFYFSMF